MNSAPIGYPGMPPQPYMPYPPYPVDMSNPQMNLAGHQNAPPTSQYYPGYPPQLSQSHSTGFEGQ